MENQTDDQIAVEMVVEAKRKFAILSSCSFDRGFHSPKNQEDLQQLLDHVVLPRKGKLSLKAKAIEHSEDFIKSRCKHSAVESAINALENHALDRCPDHRKIQKKARKRLRRRDGVARNPYRLAA
jgi:hypothetical protein